MKRWVSIAFWNPLINSVLLNHGSDKSFFCGSRQQNKNIALLASHSCTVGICLNLDFVGFMGFGGNKPSNKHSY